MLRRLMTQATRSASAPRARMALRRVPAARPLRHRACRAALVPVALGLMLGLAADARGQANSDGFSYAKSLTDYRTFRDVGKNMRQLTFARMPGLSADYKVGPGDELEVTIIGLFDGSQSLKINAGGEITIPLVGPVKAAGLTAEELESAIASRLKEKQLINDPQVLIYVSSYEAKTVYVLGELDRPGEYSVSFDISLMDLIFVAGGIDYTAARYGYLHRRTSDGAPAWRPTQIQSDFADLKRRPDVARPGTEVTVIDLQPMKDGGVLERNIVLRSGDVFYVPRRKMDVVYVIGDVIRAGAFELPQEGKMSASRVVAWAGGPAPTAKMSKGLLVRYEDTVRREFAVDFAAILRGKSPDVEVRPNDVIFIPGSTGKTLAYGLLDTIPSIVANTLLFY